MTGLALLVGTQLFHPKDFLDASDYYRMNTLFKFFNQVWVLWGILAAIAVPRIFSGWWLSPMRVLRLCRCADRGAGGFGRWVWAGVFGLLLAASLAYPILGMLARLDMRMVGWAVADRYAQRA